MVQREIGTLVVVVLKARNLPDKHTVWKQDPYVVVKMGNVTQKTEIDKRGGQHPVWDAELRIPIYNVSKPEDKLMRVSVFSDEHRGDELLGETELDISDTLRTGEFDDWVTLYQKDADRGEVYLEMTYYINAPAPLARRATKMPQHERLSRPPQPKYTEHDASPPRTPPKTPPKGSPHHTPHASQTYTAPNGLLSAILDDLPPSQRAHAQPPHQPRPVPQPAPLPATLKPGVAPPASLRPHTSFQAQPAPVPGPFSMPIPTSSHPYGRSSSPPHPNPSFSPPRMAPALPPRSPPHTTAPLHPRHPSATAHAPPPALPSSLMPHHPAPPSFPRTGSGGSAYDAPYNHQPAYPGPSGPYPGPSGAMAMPYHSPYESDPSTTRHHNPAPPGADPAYLITRYATPLPLPLGTESLPDPFSEAQRRAEAERAMALRSSQEEADAELARVLAQNEGLDIGALRAEEDRARAKASAEERDREMARRLEMELNADGGGSGRPHMPGEWGGR